MTNTTLVQLQAKYAQLESDFKRERAELEKQISEARRTELAGALANIRSIMNEYGITPSDLGKTSRKQQKVKNLNSGQVPPKYRGPNGQTWTGRGRQPKWLEGDRDQYLINK